jgi:hypothetical protein
LAKSTPPSSGIYQTIRASILPLSLIPLAAGNVEPEPVNPYNPKWVLRSRISYRGIERPKPFSIIFNILLYPI